MSVLQISSCFEARSPWVVGVLLHLKPLLNEYYAYRLLKGLGNDALGHHVLPDVGRWKAQDLYAAVH